MNTQLSTIRIIELALQKLNLDPSLSQSTESENKWLISKGSARLFIEIFEKDQVEYIQVRAPIMTWPNTNEIHFAKLLLKHNKDIIGAVFCWDESENQVLLKIERESLGLDMTEALNMIYRIGNWADKLDDELRSKFPSQAQIGYHFLQNKTSIDTKYKRAPPHNP